MKNKKPQTWKKIIDLVIVLLTAIGSFIGGQASAQNDLIDIFGIYQSSEISLQ